MVKSCPMSEKTYKINAGEFSRLVAGLADRFVVYAPCVLKDWGIFSDTDIVGYSEIQNAEQIVFDKKSMYSFKEVILPISETLFYFTDDEMKETKTRLKKERAIVFLRNCDLHALKRLDEVYRSDGNLDVYYERLRSNALFVVMGCDKGFESCFCESMETNTPANYDAYIISDGEGYIIDSKFDALTEMLESLNAKPTAFEVKNISNALKVAIPQDIPHSVIKSSMWDEYDARCISCGRCNFACPTCSCFTMQDIFYEDNKNAGERRRVWASCHVDGFSDIAGGISFRKSKAERMRFKVLHKIHDYKKRYGHNMCVGCGRCDDICTEYISFTACIARLAKECESQKEGNHAG